MSTQTFDPLTVATTDEREKHLLAPFAMFSAQSAGREHAEASHSYRGPYQRDRDRILHCSAYRRLSGKMQVFTGRMGDYHRTRLTHTQEVATIARTMGRALRLNEDLIEALALVHDIGHPPYGHAGEDVLNEVVQDIGGFSHNEFALTIVRELEIRHLESPGLNLTKEVLQGQVARVDKNQPGPRPLLEVQLVDAADSTTYDAHDTDDAIKLGLVSLEEMAQIPLIRSCLEQVQAAGAVRKEQLRKAVVHQLIEAQVTDMIEHCSREFARYKFASAEMAQHSDFIFGPSPALAKQKSELETFLHERVYRHPQLIQVRQDAQQRLHQMYTKFVEDPSRMSSRYQGRIEQVGVRRAAVEFIAGMTDHYCDHIYRREFGSL